MAENPSAAGKNARPIIAFLQLGSAGAEPHLIGKKCTQCGEVYTGRRVACSKCSNADQLEEIKLSRRGTLWTYSIVHQSLPGIKTPYIAAIVDLPERVSVRCNLIDVDPDPAKLQFGMRVEMVTRKVREDAEGNDVIAFFFRPLKS